MDVFGETDSRLMPRHFFSDAILIDHDSALQGHPEKQNYSVCPRHWYVDAVFKCGTCGQEFMWTAKEQLNWFEYYFFWVDSKPRHCKKCMASRRHLEALRKEYDSSIVAARDHGTPEQKRRIIEVVNELETAFRSLPEKMIITRDLFSQQIG